MSVITEPISTTNMTGFFTCTRGSILVTEPNSASLQDLGIEEAAGLGDAVWRRPGAGWE